MSEKMSNEKRSKYAASVYSKISKIPGNSRSFGAQCAAFVADRPEEAEALSEHHIESFLAKKAQMIRPQLVNKFIVHNEVKSKIKRYKAE